MLRCVVCGGMVTERDDLTADGLRCASCSMRAEIAGHEQNVVAAEWERKQRGLDRRARRIGLAHGALWIAALLLFSNMPDAAYGASLWPLLALAVGIPIALRFRQRWALYAALGIDGLFVAALVTMTLLDPSSDLVVGAAVIGFFPLLFGLLLYSVRNAYDPASRVAPRPVEQPQQRWSSPGRQI